MVERYGHPVGGVEQGDDWFEVPEEDEVGFDELADASVQAQDLMRLYLNEAGRRPLLTHQEEIGLAKRYELGREAQSKLEINDKEGSGLSRKQRKELELVVADGLAARDHLVEANMRFVVSIAKGRQGRGLPFLDLIQHGNLGLIKAAGKYDWRRQNEEGRPNRFSTCASQWIRQAIVRGIHDEGREIRLPVHIAIRVDKYVRLRNSLETELQRPPSDDEVMRRMGLDPDKKRDKAEYTKIVSASKLIPDSLDREIGRASGDDSDSVVGDFVEDDSPGPEELVLTSLLRDRVVESSKQVLSAQQKTVFDLWCGLDGQPPLGFEDIGERLGFSRQYVKKVFLNAVKKLNRRHGAGRL